LKTQPTLPSYFIPEPLDNTRLAHLCGPLDENLRQISAALDVTIFRRGEKFIVSGANAERAVELLERFYAVANKVVPIEEVQLALVEQRAGLKPRATDPDAAPAARADAPEEADVEAEAAPESLESPLLKTRRSDLRGRTPHQIQYLNAVLNHDISFGIGPAGTGKTYLAVACAVDALERDAVKRIILTRPAVEAGERLGFLPGDMEDKLAPYLRPLYDALSDRLSMKRVKALMAEGLIEIAPIGYMRGRTLNNAFIVVDEAQNCTYVQLKMLLTRLGWHSTMVVTGDPHQSDLLPGVSGLSDIADRLEAVPEIAVVRLAERDIVRHPLVASMIGVL